MAKKRKDLSGQLDGLFSDFVEEDAKAEEAGLGESQAVAEILGTEEVKQPQAEVEEAGQPQVEMPAETPAIDALLAAEPAVAGEAVQPQAEIEPVEAPAEVSAFDELLAAEPVAAGEAEVEPAMAELVEPPVAGEAGPPQAEEVGQPEAEIEPVVTELVEPPVAEEAGPPQAEEVGQPEAEIEPVVTELVKPPVAEEAVPPQAEEVGQPEAAEMPGLPSMAELLSAEDVGQPQVEPALPEAVVPEAETEAAPELAVVEEPVEPGPVLAEVAVAEREEVAAPEPGMERAAREDVLPAPGAPPAWEVTIQEQRVRILNALLVFITAVATLVVVGLVIASLNQPKLWGDYAPYYVAWVMLVVLTLVRRINPLWRVAGLVALAYLVGLVNVWLDGLLGAGWLYLLLAPLLLSTLVGRRVGIYAAIGSFSIYFAFVVTYMLGWWVPAVPTLKPENWTWSTVLLNLSGTFGLILAAATMIQWMFNASLETSLHEAEEKHTEAVRSREALRERAEELAAANIALQRRTLQLETASQVSQAASSVLDPDELMQQVAGLIREQFDLYYVGLFLMGEVSAGDGGGATRQQVKLEAGTGEAGRQMLAQGYSVEVGDVSAVGQCVARGQAHIALDVGERAVIFENYLLPQTRSEIALPLRSRGRVLGALDAHSAEGEAFSQEDIAVLQTMADRIAVTIDNARLFAELRRRLEEMEASQRLYVREQWADLVPRRVAPVYQRTLPGVKPLADTVLPEVKDAASRRMGARVGGEAGADQSALVAPVTLRGEIIGALGLQGAEGGRKWAEDEIALVEAVADQMALAIENVRLLEETRQLAGWEQTLSDMTARFTRSLDTETLLQAAIQEIGQLLQMDEVSVHIGTPGEIASAGEGEGTGGA
ncbi:MAG: GAF domain-containing protein [Anaerolineae bacterium]|nr:GAF domain-containing protein [Anaerolineae bacterium]